MLGLIFPINLCGVWSLISTSNPRIDNSARLEINYNDIKFTPHKNLPLLGIKKHISGKVSLINEDSGRIIWKKRRDYDIVTPIFPTIQYSLYSKIYKKYRFNYNIDNNNKIITIHDHNHEYIFRKIYITDVSKSENFGKILLTQIFIEHLIKYIDKFDKLDF
jgi:hypothetical protein